MFRDIDTHLCCGITCESVPGSPHPYLSLLQQCCNSDSSVTTNVTLVLPLIRPRKMTHVISELTIRMRGNLEVHAAALPAFLLLLACTYNKESHLNSHYPFRDLAMKQQRGASGMHRLLPCTDTPETLPKSQSKFNNGTQRGSRLLVCLYCILHTCRLLAAQTDMVSTIITYFRVAIHLLP